MAPSQLAVATSALQRLIKEEQSYHEEMKQQQKSIERLERGEGADDENAEFRLKQERKALDETKAIFPTLQERITSAREKLEALIPSMDAGARANDDEEVKRAREVAKKAKEEMAEVS